MTENGNPTVEQCRREMRDPENWGKHGVEAEIRYRYDADGKRIAVGA